MTRAAEGKHGLASTRTPQPSPHLHSEEVAGGEGGEVNRDGFQGFVGSRRLLAVALCRAARGGQSRAGSEERGWEAAAGAAAAARCGVDAYPPHLRCRRGEHVDASCTCAPGGPGAPLLGLRRACDGGKLHVVSSQDGHSIVQSIHSPMHAGLHAASSSCRQAGANCRSHWVDWGRRVPRQSRRGWSG